MLRILNLRPFNVLAPLLHRRFTRLDLVFCPPVSRAFLDAGGTLVDTADVYAQRRGRSDRLGDRQMAIVDLFGRYQ
jgi:hypothetical protein